MPWVTLMKMMKILITSSRILTRSGHPKRTSSKSFKHKLKISRAIQKKQGKKTPVEERTIPGVQIKKLREDPPKGVILRCTDQFGDHVGYASAVKLEKGQTGIVLPIHVWTDTVYVNGPNGKLKMADFTALYECTNHDSLIMTSATAGWGSILGVRPRPLTTIDAVKLKNYSLFTERDGKWYVQAAKCIAPAEGMFRVVSDTRPGDSGLPLFDMKMNVVAVHRGTWPSERFPENRAFAVLPVPDLTSSSSPKFTGCETYSEAETAYEMADNFSDGEEILIRTKGQSYRTFIGSNKVALLSIRKLEEELSRGPMGLWADDTEDDESAPRRSGNGLFRSTPEKQSQAKTPSPKVEESAAPSPAPRAEKVRHVRRSEMTPEQKKADNLRRRKAKAAKKTPSTPPKKSEDKAPTLSQVAELVEKAVRAALTVQPRRSRASSKISIGGRNPGRKPQVSIQLDPVPSQSTSVPLKDSRAGESAWLGPRRSYKPVQKSTVGQKQEPRRN